jgi:hypothetical protein
LNRKLHDQPAHDLLTMPWRAVPVYAGIPGNISTVTFPPEAAAITPACTAAAQTDESLV